MKICLGRSLQTSYTGILSFSKFYGFCCNQMKKQPGVQNFTNTKSKLVSQYLKGSVELFTIIILTCHGHLRRCSAHGMTNKSSVLHNNKPVHWIKSSVRH